MLLCELFSPTLNEMRLDLSGGGNGADTPAARFMAEFTTNTESNMFNPRQRVFGMAVIELSHSINDRAAAIHISDMVSREKGEGSKALAFLCQLADAHGVTLELFAKGYADTPTAKLHEWYGRYGFVDAPDYYGDDDEGYEMVRQPKQTIKLRGFNRPH